VPPRSARQGTDTAHRRHRCSRWRGRPRSPTPTYWSLPPAWGEHEIRRLHAELTDIDVSAAQVLGSRDGSPRLEPPPRW